jgi:Uma2 family endonuclease
MVIPDKQKLYTVEEFEAYIAQPENTDRLLELINGEIIEKMPTELHAGIVFLIVGHLFVYFQQNPIGWALPEARYGIPKDRRNSRIPDVSIIIGRDRPLVEKGAAPFIPDLAIEVQSPDDTLKKMRQKADYYLEHGAKMVWLIYTESRLAEVCTPDGEHLLNLDQELNGGEILPGFKLAVRDIFPQ